MGYATARGPPVKFPSGPRRGPQRPPAAKMTPVTRNRRAPAGAGPSPRTALPAAGVPGGRAATLALGLLLLAACTPRGAQAATFTVTNTNGARGRGARGSLLLHAGALRLPRARQATRRFPLSTPRGAAGESTAERRRRRPHAAARARAARRACAPPPSKRTPSPASATEAHPPPPR